MWSISCLFIETLVVGFSRYGGNDGAAYDMIGSSFMFSPRIMYPGECLTSQ